MKKMNMVVVSSVEDIIYRSVAEVAVVTHVAPHHGDDAMSMAILSMLLGKPLLVYRTRNEQEIQKAAAVGATIVDVGGVYDPAKLRFDHHQRDFAEMRSDGTKYSSAGLLWKEYGVKICTTFCLEGQAEEAAKLVDEYLIRGIDAADYGVRLPGDAWSISSVLGGCNRTYKERVTPDPYALNAQVGDDDIFLEACELAAFMLWRAIEQAASVLYGRREVEKAVQDAEGRIMILPEFIGGWIQTVLATANPKSGEILYGVYQDIQGGWKVQAIPPSADTMNLQRKPLPKAWRGLNGTALQEATGVADAIFCHAGGFICGTKSYKGALRLAELAVAAEE